MSKALSPPVRAAVQRSRWLAELARALDQSARLVEQLRAQSGSGGELRMLGAQIAALRGEISLLQRGRGQQVEFPKSFWTD